jgi:hypothetical protein
LFILTFRGNKDLNFEAFLIEYKKAYIGTKLKTNVKWFNLFLEFLEVQHRIGLKNT